MHTMKASVIGEVA